MQNRYSRKWGLLLDGKLSSKMNNIIPEVWRIFSNEVLPLHSKKIAVTNRLAACKNIAPLRFWHKLPGGLHSRCKLVVDSKAHRALLLKYKTHPNWHIRSMKCDYFCGMTYHLLSVYVEMIQEHSLTHITTDNKYHPAIMLELGPLDG